MIKSPYMTEMLIFVFTLFLASTLFSSAKASGRFAIFEPISQKELAISQKCLPDFEVKYYSNPFGSFYIFKSEISSDIKRYSGFIYVTTDSSCSPFFIGDAELFIDGSSFFQYEMGDVIGYGVSNLAVFEIETKDRIIVITYANGKFYLF